MKRGKKRKYIKRQTDALSKSAEEIIGLVKEIERLYLANLSAIRVALIKSKAKLMKTQMVDDEG